MSINLLKVYNLVNWINNEQYNIVYVMHYYNIII